MLVYQLNRKLVTYDAISMSYFPVTNIFCELSEPVMIIECIRYADSYIQRNNNIVNDIHLRVPKLLVYVE